ncbi:MAG TPA: hypothetical protein VFP30_07700, partial [Candidatus Limnocylindria bacterium]|nr:hypothetical protein [Candidatus Limnocylindria bacterium]
MKVRLLVVALVVLSACTATTDPGGAPPSTEPPPPASAPPSEAPATPDPTAEPTGAPRIAYEPAQVPASENGSSTITIVPGGEGLVAIGFDGGFGSLLWTSADGGRTWTDITPPDFASIGIASVVEFDGMLVGVGRGDTINVDAEEAAVYLSDDGVSWRKVETATELVGQMIDVVATDDGLFAVGGV